MKKLFSIIAILALLLTLCALPASAADGGAGEDIVTEEPTTESTEPTASATQTLSAWITEHVGDITGSISAVGLAILSWFISKRLIPAVKSAINTVATKSAASEGAFKEKVDAVAKLLEEGVKRLEETQKNLNEMQASLQKRIAANAKAYELQTDLINYLFLNLRIPNDLKTSINEKAEKVKEAINESGKE